MENGPSENGVCAADGGGNRGLNPAASAGVFMPRGDRRVTMINRIKAHPLIRFPSALDQVLSCPISGLPVETRVQLFTANSVQIDAAMGLNWNRDFHPDL